MLSRDEIEACYVALLAGLWAEMEGIVGLHYTENAFGPGAPERVGLRVEALLLEIGLLRGRCDWMQAQGRLTAGQADRLRDILVEIEELLDREPVENPLIRTSATIVRAQNRLLDELLRATAAHYSRITSRATSGTRVASMIAVRSSPASSRISRSRR